VPTLSQIFHVLFISHVVEIKIMRSIVPVNLQLSINVTGMSECLSDCAMMGNLFLEILLQLRTVLLISVFYCVVSMLLCVAMMSS